MADNKIFLLVGGGGLCDAKASIYGKNHAVGSVAAGFQPIPTHFSMITIPSRPAFTNDPSKLTDRYFLEEMLLRRKWLGERTRSLCTSSAAR
jgi:hypothetical protein